MHVSKLIRAAYVECMYVFLFRKKPRILWSYDSSIHFHFVIWCWRKEWWINIFIENTSAFYRILNQEQFICVRYSIRDPCRIKFWWIPAKKSRGPLVHSLLFFVKKKIGKSQTQIMSPELVQTNYKYLCSMYCKSNVCISRKYICMTIAIK